MRQPKEGNVFCPVQKTFQFDEDQPAHKIDEEVNKWLEEKASRGQIPQFGKSHLNPETGVLTMIYFYTKEIQAKK